VRLATSRHIEKHSRWTQSQFNVGKTPEFR
jgi:hypothetical protein